VTWAADAAGVVSLPDGRRVRARGLRAPVPEGEPPQFGVYLLARDPGPLPWPHRWVHWPDFRLPTDPADAVRALREVHARSVSERVEVACQGGVGRTGCALAVLAGLSGVCPQDRVEWVRSHYRPGAVETPWQRRWVRRVDVGAQPPNS